jgi:hypothetical protein
MQHVITPSVVMVSVVAPMKMLPATTSDIAIPESGKGLHPPVSLLANMSFIV